MGDEAKKKSVPNEDNDDGGAKDVAENENDEVVTTTQASFVSQLFQSKAKESTPEVSSQTKLDISKEVRQLIRERGDTECHICKLEFEENDMVRLLPCCHLYHHTCIVTWLNTGAGHYKCPACNLPINSKLKVD